MATPPQFHFSYRLFSGDGYNEISFFWQQLLQKLKEVALEGFFSSTGYLGKCAAQEKDKTKMSFYHCKIVFIKVQFFGRELFKTLRPHHWKKQYILYRMLVGQ
jgi:hypothetical protein